MVGCWREPEDHGGIVAGRFSQDGSTYVARNPSGQITIRDPISLKFIGALERGTRAGEEPSRDPDLSPDDDFLLRTRDSLRLWHLPTGTLIGTFPHGRRLVATGNAGETRRRARK